MEIAFVIVLAAMLGFGVRYLVRGRTSHGLMLVPAIATAVSAATWAVLVWLGLTFDNGWIWVISLAAGVAAALIAALMLPGRRARADERFFEAAQRGA